jgi:hypothetical protein
MTETAAGAGQAIQGFVEALAKLSPQERAELQQRGCVLPHLGKKLTTINKFGYRCKHCGKIGLEFVGEQFDNGAGELMNKPPTGLRVENLPWVQPNLRLDQVNRAAPRCQCCLTTLPTSNGYLFEKHVVDMALYKSSRDKAFEEMAKAKRAQNQSTATHNADGSPIRMDTDYDANDDKLLAQTKANLPDEFAATQELASKLDLTGFLAKGPSGSKTAKR